MYKINTTTKVKIKVVLTLFVIYYLATNIDLNFIKQLQKYYFFIFIIIPILILKIFVNSLKISNLIKIIKKKKPNLRKIFNILLIAQLSTGFPASFVTSKVWVDTNLVKNFKLNFKDYIKINLFIILCTALVVILLLIFINNLNVIYLILSTIFIFSFIFKKYKDYSMYFFFFLTNLLLNSSISFIIIYLTDPTILQDNFIQILISTIIVMYLNLFSLLPFNIGFSQMLYGMTFEFFSLPVDLALLIATIKQVSQILIVIFISIYLQKNIKKDKI